MKITIRVSDNLVHGIDFKGTGEPEFVVHDYDWPRTGDIENLSDRTDLVLGNDEYGDFVRYVPSYLNGEPNDG